MKAGLSRTAAGTDVSACIVSVEARELSLPLPAPVRNGTTLIADRQYTVVDVRSDSGASGTACVLTRQAPLAAIVEGFVAPRVVNRPLAQLDELRDEVYRAGELFLGRSGAFPRALSLVDIALWDLRGKLLNKSVAELLGATRPDVPVLMALGYYQDGDELELLRAEYSKLCADGFRRFKLMAGGADVARDMRRIAAVAEVLPPDATLGVDVNGAWNTARDATEFLDASPIALDFIEDPFRPDDLNSLAELRRQSNVPIAVGEWESGHRRFAQLMELDLVDIVRVDATAAGGIGEWLKIVQTAELLGKRVLPHYYPEIHVHLALVSHAVEAVEAVPAITGADNFGLLTKATSWQEQPRTSAGSAGGFGIDWDREMMARHLVPGSRPMPTLEQT